MYFYREKPFKTIFLDEKGKINEPVEKENKTIEASTTSTQKDIVEGNETFNSTDDAQTEDKIVEEVETTTGTEAPTTAKVVSRGRGRRPRPNKADK